MQGDNGLPIFTHPLRDSLQFQVALGGDGVFDPYQSDLPSGFPGISIGALVEYDHKYLHIRYLEWKITRINAAILVIIATQ